ncbi:MAG: 2-keto-4-pentenoate hydratase/2-oxohepta-3-ene-1,7-dioic acid hydratase in catechol pathway [Paraglaciecola psychrophila]
MDYSHQLTASIEAPVQLGKIVCVGRNYAAHARELNNPIPQQPLLFIKPATAAVAMAGTITLPSEGGQCHHELEMALLIGHRLSAASNDDEIAAAVVAVGLALDLTLRDLQDSLKSKGQPWERAKAFDGSCPLSNFVPVSGHDLQAMELSLQRNGQLQQTGNSRDMLFPINTLLREISAVFTLLPGDVVLTGTPAGVGPLHSGDQLIATLGHILTINTTVN